MGYNKNKIVILNQAANYLTIGICNEFAKACDVVTLITGSVHVQGEELSSQVNVEKIIPWKEEHGIGKAINYASALFSMGYLLMTKYRNHEVFFISVPPMGYLLNIVLPHKFSMIIWDVYPDVLKITGMQDSHPVYKFWSKLNRISFKKAYKVLTIGDKMAELIGQYVDNNKVIIQPIWSIFQSNNKVFKEDNPFVKKHNLEDKFIIQYSGNIGLSHKVEVMVALAEKMQDHKEILFQIIGRGPRKKSLKELVKVKNLQNCQFLPFQSDKMFPFSLSAADLGIVILDETTSKGSVPSKSYNLMSYGIPSLYIAADDSELQNYANKYKHANCFTEKELDKAEVFILKLSKDKKYYNKLSVNSLKAASNFKRENAAKFVEEYLEA